MSQAEGSLSGKQHLLLLPETLMEETLMSGFAALKMWQTSMFGAMEIGYVG